MNHGGGVLDLGGFVFHAERSRPGVAPPRPWIPNDGRWDAFAAESPRMLRRYLEEFRMPAERVVLTGAMSDDVLHAGRQNAGKLKEQVYRELGLPPGRPMVLVSFPSNQFGSGRPTNWAAVSHPVKHFHEHPNRVERSGQAAAKFHVLPFRQRSTFRA